MSPVGQPNYAASAKQLTKGRASMLMALEAAGERGLSGTGATPGAMLAALVSLGWADRIAGDGLSSRFVINPAGREMLRQAKSGKAG